MALLAQPFDRRGDDDDWKNNRDDRNDSESGDSSDEDKPRKKVIFVRCVHCRDKKSAVSLSSSRHSVNKVGKPSSFLPTGAFSWKFLLPLG